MKKRIFAILLALTLALTLLPTAVFATGEDGAAEPQEQQEEVKPEEPQGQPEQPEQPEAKPAEEKGAQEKQEEPAPQPAQSAEEPVVLNSEGETVIKLTQSNISNYMSSGLTDGSYQLGENVTVERGSLEVKGTVTLDLNGHTLLFKDPELYYPPKQGQVNAGIRVYNSDSSESAAKYALTLCDTSTAKTGTLDVWGESMAESGEGLFVGQNGELTMTGGTITDSSETNPWGIGIGIIEGRVTMTGGKIENQTRCGVTLAGGTFEMSGDAVISNCGGNNSGGGIWIGGGTLTMTGGTIENCNATWGGGVYVGAGSTFNMSGGSIENCKASADGSSAFGGGIYNAGRTTLSGTAKIRNCQAANAGGGIYDYSVLNISDNVEITGCTAPLWSTMTVSGTISGGTFDGTVVNNGTITGGTFTGEVTNHTTITGGTFNDKVTNHGTITGGTFNDGIIGIAAHVTGSGTETDPYQIGTAIGLEWFRDKVNDGETEICAVLTADIALDSNEAWTPIGPNTSGAYTGTFDGNGHTISGLNVSGALINAGLFGVVTGGTIKNLTVAGKVSPSTSQCIAGGIVGHALNATIKNCSNHCSVTGIVGSFIGGIAGFSSSGAIIVDCYNVGTISGINYAAASGGIVGSNSGTISNCYNVGKVSGGDHVGEIAGDNFGTVENCYYLNATNNNAVGKNKGTITSTKSMTAAEFADGTVLKLLKAGTHSGTNDPWDSVSKEWNGMVLPGFTWQSNNHTHTWGKWMSNDDDTHSRTCACGVTETGKCSGGTATCTEKATCSTCGTVYGSVLGHDFTVSEHDDNNHWMKCSRCDAKSDVNPHEWDDGTVTTQPTCTKAGEKTYTCTECGAAKTQTIDATGHKWESKWTSDTAYHWHKCLNDNCDMKDSYAAHSGGTATCTEKAVCSTCKQAYGEVDPNNHVGGEELRSKKDATCTEKGYTGDTYCKGCNTMIKAGAEINALDHDWGKWASNKDGTHTRVCSRDKSHTETGKCSGGKADCCHKAECTVCGGKYGNLDPDNHSDLKHFPAKRATTRAEGNIEYWYCSGCGKYYRDEAATKEITQKDTVIRKRRPSGDSTTTDDKTVKSVKTGDAGIALYVGMAALSLTGGAWLRRKKQ